MKIKRNSISDKLLCAFFPRRCKYCGEVILPEEELCEACKAYLPETEEPVCFYCGHSKEDCKCKKHKHYYDKIAAPFYYEGAIVKAVDRLKFRQKPFLSEAYAEDMVNTIDKLYSEVKFDGVCCIPFSNQDRRRREFNQSELLARHISEKTGIELLNVLVKNYETSTQHMLKSSGRRGNVFAAFDVENPEIIKGKRILLVDDIKTTGATLDECAKMLKIYGADEVYAICFAVAKKKQNIDTSD